MVLGITIAIIRHDVAQPATFLIDFREQAVTRDPVHCQIGVDASARTASAFCGHGLVDAKEREVGCASQSDSPVPSCLNGFANSRSDVEVGEGELGESLARRCVLIVRRAAVDEDKLQLPALSKVWLRRACRKSGSLSAALYKETITATRISGWR